jgi:hypothetical protein
MGKHGQGHASGGKAPAPAPAEKPQGTQELGDPNSLTTRLRDANENLWSRIGAFVRPMCCPDVMYPTERGICAPTRPAPLPLADPHLARVYRSRSGGHGRAGEGNCSLRKRAPPQPVQGVHSRSRGGGLQKVSPPSPSRHHQRARTPHYLSCAYVVVGVFVVLTVSVCPVCMPCTPSTLSQGTAGGPGSRTCPRRPTVSSAR